MAALERRLPGAAIFLWADAATTALLAADHQRWPVVTHAGNVFSGNTMNLANAPASLPDAVRGDPGNLVFVLPAGTVINDVGLPSDSAWRNVRLLVIEQVLGLLRVMTLQRRMIIDRVVEHLVAARQA